MERAKLENTQLQRARLWWAKLWEAKLRGANLTGVDLAGVDLEGADLFGVQLTEKDFNKLSDSISKEQKADLIVLALARLSVSRQTYRLTATRKTATVTHQIRKKIECTISRYLLDEQKTKELNQENWDIEIKKNAI